jgi:tetratricopeptide (TPR) repeat protein
MVLQLARAEASLPERIRLLLLERETSGSWWPDFLREASYSESVDIAASQFALPMRLSNLTESALRDLVADVSRHFGVELTDAEREEAIERATRIDPVGRPLFAMIAAAAQLTGISQQTREEMVRFILDRERARWQSIVAAAEPREKMLNLLVLTTVLGGELEPTDITGLRKNSEIASLLPDPYFFDDKRFSELAGSAVADSGLPGFQPDLIGEFFILERLRGPTGIQMSTRALLDAGWDYDPEALSQFVRRAVGDFPSAPSTGTIQEPVTRTAVQREAWSRLASDLVKSQGNSKDEQGARNLNALRKLANEYPSEVVLQENRATAEFNLGYLLLLEDEYESADQQFSLSIKLSPPGSDVQTKSLNNRGIARYYARSQEESRADYSAVIATENSSDEAKACSLNNRADIFSERGDIEEAIRDRSIVIDLKETSYNRRYIAHIRRSNEYLKLGKTSDALADLLAILNTKDIVPEQKMEACLQRARIFQQQGQNAEALADLDEVIRSPVNFFGIVSEALLLRGQVHLALGEEEQALEDFRAVVVRDDSRGSAIAEAYLESGHTLMTTRRQSEALASLVAARDHPKASDDIRRRSSDLIASLRIG